MIAEFESRILALIDDMVEHASDDELFASGYLRGHLTLAVAELEAGDDHSAEAIHDEVSRSRKSHPGGRAFSPRPVSGAGYVGQPVPAGESEVSVSPPSPGGRGHPI